jgi:hypothetical protein
MSMTKPDDALTGLLDAAREKGRREELAAWEAERPAREAAEAERAQMLAERPRPASRVSHGAALVFLPLLLAAKGDS